MKKLLCLLFVLVNIIVYSQTTPSPPCATDEIIKAQILKNPQLKLTHDAMNEKISKLSPNGVFNRTTTTNITIPVIVYVVNSGEALGVGTNISDAQVQSQITSLNNSFSSSGIKFCLATRSGAGTTSIPMVSGSTSATPGIIHVNSSLASNHSYNEASEAILFGGYTPDYRIRGENFLRIYVVKTINNPNGTASNIIGYGSFPSSSWYDGVVMRYDAFGDNTTCPSCNLLPGANLGKVLVHEVGHYLFLYHTFEQGCNGSNDNTTDASGILNCVVNGDRVCDTPQARAYNTGCPTSVNSCFGDLPGDLPDAVNNYMDYTNDLCRFEFSSGQSSRMVATLNTYRASLITNDNLIYTGVCGYQSLLSATFKPSTYQACSAASVTLTPLVANAANTIYLWNFGDGTATSNSTSAVNHIFNSAIGSPYTVTLTVTKTVLGTVTTSVFSTQIYVTNCTSLLGSNSNWYFSTSNGLKFGTGVPVVDTSIPIANNFENSSATQSDNLGNLLFYTNGVTVWKANHTILNSSTGVNVPLKGNLWSKDGVLVIAIPGTSSYYILTKGSDQNPSDVSNYLDGFTTTKITMVGSVPSMPVTTINIPVIPLLGMSGFSLGNNSALVGGTAINALQKCDGYWIFTTLKKTTGELLLTVFSLTSLGLSYSSSVILPNSKVNYEIIRIAPNGNRIIYGMPNFSDLLMFDFDKFSGTLSNQKTLLTYPLAAVEGGEFSSDSNLFYTSDLFNNLYQFNLNSTNPFLTKKIVSTSLINSSMKRGPDDKIYFIDANNIFDVSGNYQLRVIHNPNNLITNANLNACNLSKNGPVFPRSVYDYIHQTLPNTVPSLPPNSISYNPTACNTYKFFPNVAQASCYSSFKWDFGDVASGIDNSSTLNNPTHTFLPGTYIVKLFSNTNILIAQTTVTVIELQYPSISGSTEACITSNSLTNNSIILQSNQTVVWTVEGGTGTITGANNRASVDVNWSALPGQLVATITDDSGCIANDQVSIKLAYCNNGANYDVYTTKIQADGKIIIGGVFTLYKGISVNRVARLNTNLTLDTTFNVGTGADFRIETSAIQSDGKIIIGGSFSTYNGVARKGIARLNTNGTLDTTFAIGTGVIDANYSAVQTIAIQTDGKILIGGSFTTYNGVIKINIARLNSNGSLDTSFSSSFSTSSGNSVNCIAIQTDGKIILGGNFLTYGSTNGSKIIRLNTNGTIDSTFVVGTGFNGPVRCLKLQIDGKILAGGNFYFFNGINRSHLARLNTSGAIDNTFVPSLISFPLGGYGVKDLDIQTDGKIVIVGGFQTIGSLLRNRIARLSSIGILDTSFNPGTGFGPTTIGDRLNSSFLYSVNVQTDGKFVVSGSFSSYNGIPINNFTRLNPNITGATGRYKNSQYTEEVNYAKAISIYPNPVSDNFTISSPDISIDKVEIYNTIGQLVKVQKLIGSESVVSIENLSAGLYNIKIYNNGKLLKSNKIIKK
ncbi:M43 family zinc metalloprotease [Flavobacterium myungsuense]|uniref:M43 family zinc metalloprotease n=1 Tax=Flavobacterium myungsuense TaxID=651823 RepID=A0ABW3J1F9_9FLAO